MGAAIAKDVIVDVTKDAAVDASKDAVVDTGVKATTSAVSKVAPEVAAQLTKSGKGVAGFLAKNWVKVTAATAIGVAMAEYCKKGLRNCLNPVQVACAATAGVDTCNTVEPLLTPLVIFVVGELVLPFRSKATSALVAAGAAGVYYVSFSTASNDKPDASSK